MTSREKGTPNSLADLLAPLDAEDFKKSVWGKSFQHNPGWSGKFRGLLPWPALNQILRQHRLDSPRLRLMREGKAIPPENFVKYTGAKRRSFEKIPRLQSGALQKELRQGATLILDSVDELHEPLTALSEHLETIFRVRVQVNAYAGWHTSRGFDLHWDDHDVLILQASGRKHWKIYEMTRPFPLARDSEANTVVPTKVSWEGVLEDGAMLYIPRGWWHVALPLDEPTLHLTVGFHNPTGADLLSWFVDGLRSSIDVRRDLPLFGDQMERGAYLERLRSLILDSWRPELLEDFLRYRDGLAEPRPAFSLPSAALDDVLPPESRQTSLKWRAPRPNLLVDLDAIEVICSGRKYRFSRLAEPLLRCLADGRIVPIQALYEMPDVALDKETIKAFIRELLLLDLVAVVHDDGD